MNVDAFYGHARSLISDVRSQLATIETEADARFRMIDRFLVEALGWDRSDFKMEPHTTAGYTDYLLHIGGTATFVVEAKRVGKILVDTVDKRYGSYVISGPALKSASSGFSQAVSYCIEHGVDFAALTTGEVWIAFIAFRSGGKSYREYKAIVFPNLDSIETEFAAFYDLFSKEGLSKKLYRTHFAKIDGVSAKSFEPLISANKAQDAKLLRKSELAQDLDPILTSFFSDLAGHDDPDLRRHCFVETRESRTADLAMQKMISSISSTVIQIATDTGQQIADHIDATVESGRSSTILIAGGEGSGKSTFINRFFEDILDRSLKEKCLIVRIDLSKIIDNPSTAASDLTSVTKKLLEAQMFSDGYPKYDDLLGLYFDEYKRWSEGQHKTLYETDKSAFKVKFGEFLDESLRDDPITYVIHMLENVAKNRKKVPVLVFDNSDSRSVAFQEVVYEWSQTIKRKIPVCLIIFPISDKTIWRLSREGPFRLNQTRIFYLPTPSTREVLTKRIDYLKDRSSKHKGKERYFLDKGIHLKLKDINAFAACMEEIFVNEDFISRRIGWLTNHNLSKGLELSRNIITSPYLSIDELVGSYLKREKPHVTIKHRKFMQALISGDYNQFDVSKHGYIRDVFETSADFPSSPLLTLSLIKLLIDKAGEEGSNTNLGFAAYDQIASYFSAMLALDDAVRDCLERALADGLIEPFDADDRHVNEQQRFAVTHAGRMHYEMALRDEVYVAHMAFATPIRSHAVVDALRSIKNSSMKGDEWRNVCGIFIKHCVQDDKVFLNIPADSMFAGQTQLRTDLVARWVESSSEASRNRSSQGTTIGAETRDSVRAKVKWFDAGKGYGFATDIVSGEDIFLSARLFRERFLDVPEENSIVICDVGPGKEGRLQAVMLHSVEIPGDRGIGETNAKGVVKFYDETKGFGFVTIAGSGEDVYIPRRVAHDLRADLAPGVPVSIQVRESRGRGLEVRSLKLEPAN